MKNITLFNGYIQYTIYSIKREDKFRKKDKKTGMQPVHFIDQVL